LGVDTKLFANQRRPREQYVAQNTSNRSSAIDGCTTRHAGFLVSQQKRKLVEAIFGWLKTV
jgi:hypothetical protein